MADFFCYIVEGDAIGARDMFFGGVVLPRGEDEHVTGINGIEESCGGFVIIAKAVIGKVDDGMMLQDEEIENFSFFFMDKR